MAVTVTLPIAAPTELTSTLVEGGTLDASTTYYYIVIAYNQNRMNPTSGLNYHSPISAESSFTTDASNRSVTINWTNVTGATNYQVMLTKTSGDYTGAGSGGYGGIASETLGSITNGVTGLTITAISTSTVGFHSVQMKNALLGDVTKTGGTIQVLLDGTTAITSLTTIYDAIVAAGFSDYVSWDGHRFVLKGYIYSNNGTGSLVITSKSLFFIKGGIYNSSASYIFRFGTWVSDIYGANYNVGCHIDIAHSRYSIYSIYTNTLQIYGCLITESHSVISSITEYFSFLNYNGAGGQEITGNVSKIKDCVLGFSTRSISSNISDIKMSFTNNFTNLYHTRVKILNEVLAPYSATPLGFYQCTHVGATLSCYSGSSTHTTSGYNVRLHDDVFPTKSDNILVQGDFYYGSMVAGATTSDQYWEILYSVKFQVLDENITAISGATINGVDKDGNPAVWWAHDGTVNRYETGVSSTDDQTTDANGLIDYYLKQQKVTLDPANTTYPYSYQTIHTLFYPYTFTISKTGYETTTVVIDKLNERKIIPVTLKSVIPQKITVDGEVIQALEPELGSNSKLLVI